MLNKELQLNMIQAVERMKKAKSSMIFEDISKGEFFTLEMINKYNENNCHSEGICVSDIAKGLKISSSAISRMLRQLEEKEFITRTVDKTDRRNTYVNLTSLGNEKRINAASILKEFLENIITRMGDQKVTQLIDLINEMSDIMEDEFETRRKER
jgi:DNA-binding MarR family transcriptional regulator